MYGPSRFGEGRAYKTEGKVFLDTDRPRPGNNIFIFIAIVYERIRIGLFNYAVMCACRARVSAERSEKMSVTDPRLIIFDTNRGNGAE